MRIVRLVPENIGAAFRKALDTLPDGLCLGTVGHHFVGLQSRTLVWNNGYSPDFASFSADGNGLTLTIGENESTSVSTSWRQAEQLLRPWLEAVEAETGISVTVMLK